ncbi:MAG TPA: hypothetical protein VE734_02800, partial [Terriglobales bacterium]|nr:hypothetical protein [Terriglobales bacterium]
LVERQNLIEQRCELQVMSEVQKQKQNPFPLRLEAQPKAKALRFQPGSIVGALETLSRVEMNAQHQGALDSVSCADASVCLDTGRCSHTRDDTIRGISVSSLGYINSGML